MRLLWRNINQTRNRLQMKQYFTIEWFANAGFKELKGDTLDNGDYYRWWQLDKNDSNITITYEYTKEGKYLGGYVEFNGEQLKGKILTKEDIKLLIEIM